MVRLRCPRSTRCQARSARRATHPTQARGAQTDSLERALRSALGVDWLAETVARSADTDSPSLAMVASMLVWIASSGAADTRSPTRPPSGGSGRRTGCHQPRPHQRRHHHGGHGVASDAGGVEGAGAGSGMSAVCEVAVRQLAAADHSRSRARAHRPCAAALCVRQASSVGSSSPHLRH
jgi:hypothetical protein